MRTLFIILTLLLSAVPSRAVIPLELVAEIQLPDSTVDWDVQHWMDDSTFGWVAATKDSVIYSTNGTTTNAADFDYENPEAPAWRFVNVRIIKMPELLDHVTFFSIMKDSSFRGYSFYRWAVMFDLEADTLLRSWGPWEDENNDNSESLVSLSAVPDLPSATRFVTWNGSLEWWSDHATSDGEGAQGLTTLWSTQAGDTLIPIPAYAFRPSFYSSMPLHVVTASYYHSHIYDWGWDVYSSQSSIQFISQESTITIRSCSDTTATMCPNPFAVAQTESDGTEQAIVSDGSCYRIADGSLAWELEDDLETFFVGRVVPRGSQEVFVLNGARFNVLDASTGSLIDSTATVLGTPHYFLQSADGIAEIVTYQQNTRTVRVYRPDIAPIAASIVYLPASNSIRLRWSPIPGAASYRICRTNQSEDEECADMYYVIGGTSLTLPVSTTRAQSFYSVRAVFE